MQSHAICNEYHCKPIDALRRGILTARSQRPERPDRSPDSGRGRYGAQARNAKEYRGGSGKPTGEDGWQKTEGGRNFERWEYEKVALLRSVSVDLAELRRAVALLYF